MTKLEEMKIEMFKEFDAMLDALLSVRDNDTKHRDMLKDALKINLFHWVERILEEKGKAS